MNKYHKQKLLFSGRKIPKGTNIVVFTYGIQRDSEHYEDPHIFNPSRFENIDGKKPFSFIPFSAGPRNCIGKSFQRKSSLTLTDTCSPN